MKKILSLFLLSAVFLTYADKVIIYNTTDMHGVAKATGKPGGFLSITEKIRLQREKEGFDRTLYIDCGDLFQGTAPSYADRGRGAVAALNRAKCDVWVPGNHDFEFTIPVLKERIQEFKGTFLAGNLAFLSGPDVAKWKMFERGGLRIAVIGLTNQYLDTWLFDLPGKGIRVIEMQPALDSMMKEILIARPDAIVLAVHAGQYAAKRFRGGLSLDKFLKRYPQINLVLGGHSHECVPGLRLKHSGIRYAQAGHRAGGFIRASIEKKGRVTVSSEWIPAMSSDPVPRWITVPEEDKTLLTGKAPAIDSSNPEKSSIPLFHAAIRKAFPDVKAVFHGPLSKYSFKGGIFTRKDLFGICPFENTVILASLTPAQLRKVISAYGGAPRCSGIRKEGPLKLVMDDGRILKNEKTRVLCAFNSYDAASGGLRLPIMKTVLSDPAAGARDTGIMIRNILEQYIRGL